MMSPDIKFVKELRALKREATINVEWLSKQVIFGNWSEAFKREARIRIGVYKDQIEFCDSQIREELRK